MDTKGSFGRTEHHDGFERGPILFDPGIKPGRLADDHKPG
jgi:hypothetical protein